MHQPKEKRKKRRIVFNVSSYSHHCFVKMFGVRLNAAAFKLFNVLLGKIQYAYVGIFICNQLTKRLRLLYYIVNKKDLSILTILLFFILTLDEFIVRVVNFGIRWVTLMSIILVIYKKCDSSYLVELVKVSE